MFVKNDDHRQVPLISDMNRLPEPVRQSIETGWAGVFYREVFSRIPEEPFSVLYSENASRPNVPVNVLAGLQMLKASHGWSDAEMYANFCCNLEVRYALGYRNLDEGYFCIRSYYNFSRRVVSHCEETGEHLILQTFEEITDGQMLAYSINSSHQRMDSTQIASNIQSYSRLQLLVETVKRQYRVLSEADQAKYEPLLSPYLGESSSHYLYRLKGNHDEQLLKIGQIIEQLVVELAPTYGDDPVYQQLVRVFDEHFVVEPTLRAKERTELKATSLQSPDDDDVTYRRKAGEDYTGYVANVTETCHEDNPFQMITGLQLEPNCVDDPELLQKALPNLTERTDLEELITDGGFGSPEVDQALREEDIELTQTAIRGRKPDPDTLNLADCEITLDPDNQQPISITTPDGQTTTVEPGRKPNRFIARWEDLSEETPDETTDHHPDISPTAPPDDDQQTPPQPPPVLYFSQADLDLALRRQRLKQFRQTKGNPRAAIEATIGAIKRPFNNDKLPVRGKIRAFTMVIGSAAMVNLRRIARFQNQNGSSANQIGLPSRYFFRLIRSFLRPRFLPPRQIPSTLISLMP